MTHTRAEICYHNLPGASTPFFCMSHLLVLRPCPLQDNRGENSRFSTPLQNFTLGPTTAIGKKQAIFVEIDSFLSNSPKDRFKNKQHLFLSKKYQDTACRTSKQFSSNACLFSFLSDVFSAVHVQNSSLSKIVWLTHLLSSCCFAAGSFLRSSCCRNNLTCTSTWEGHQRGFQKKAKQPQLPGLGPPIMALKVLNNEAVISAARSIII